MEYNNRYLYFHLKDQKKVPVLDPKLFSVENYDRNGKARIGAENMTFDNVSAYADSLLHHPDYELLGICLTDDMPDKPVVPKCSALLYKAKNGEHFWFTVKSSELGEILL